jgi:hypothetical protein
MALRLSSREKSETLPQLNLTVHVASTESYRADSFPSPQPYGTTSPLYVTHAPDPEQRYRSHATDALRLIVLCGIPVCEGRGTNHSSCAAVSRSTTLSFHRSADTSEELEIGRSLRRLVGKWGGLPSSLKQSGNSMAHCRKRSLKTHPELFAGCLFVSPQRQGCIYCRLSVIPTLEGSYVFRYCI